MARYFQQLILLMAISILSIHSTEINHPAIEESIKILRESKSLPEFTAIFHQIDLKNLLLNTTSGIDTPKYKAKYIKTVARTKNLHTFINTEKLIADIQTVASILDENTFLELVLKNIDALKSLNAFDWFSATQLNNKDDIAYLAGIPDGVSVECGTKFVEYFGKILTGNDTSLLFCLQNMQTALESPAGPMIDSWGKVSPRILINTQPHWLGAFEQCQSIPHAKYCAVDMVVMRKYPGVYGTCMPKQCTEHDIGSIYQSIFNRQRDMVEYLGVGHVNCADEKIEYSDGFIATICLCGVLLLFILLGTLTDVLDEQITSFSNRCTASKRNSGVENAAEVWANEHVSDDAKEKGTVVISPEVATRPEEDRPPTPEPKPIKKPLIIQVLLCFSLPRNAKAVFSTEVPKGAIQAINGIRAISISWVILGHFFFFTTIIKNFDNSSVALFNHMRAFPAQVVNNAFVSVDTFFLLSGVLMSYLALRQMDKTKGRFNLPLYYLHRFIRITPPYMFVILIWTNVYPYMFTGPLAKQTRITGDGGNCAKYWWTNMLYINNFYPEEMGETVKDKTCVGWSWYLANDMQFSVIAPFILIAFYKLQQRFKDSRLVHTGAFIITFICCLATILIRMILLIVHNFPGLVITMTFDDHPFNNDGRQDNLYVKPYVRFSPYIMGMLLGYVFSRKIELPSKLKRILIPILWVLTFGLGFCVVYAPYFRAYQFAGEHYSKAENVIYGSMSEFTWALVVAWVLYACHNGFAGFINTFLSWKCWIPLSRLTFGAYLLHPLVIFYFFLVQENSFHFQNNIFAFAYVSNLFFSFVMAFILAMSVEYPVMNLEKLLFKH
ncbi:nose resistant to fluoxetine protein 6-like isoform X3 [Clytia hemisphaerica]|uniref:nose resistant to fluoxetine protein 6-like isoform X2 n=1 Tax=Clytia hemisphaerica TaxID=252671 RepID=UPI0034D73E23